MSLILGYGTVINEIDKIDIYSFIDYFNSQHINIYNKNNKIYIILNSTKVNIIDGNRSIYIDPCEKEINNIKCLLKTINEIYDLKLSTHGFYIF
jgi:hypothetical protein